MRWLLLMENHEEEVMEVEKKRGNFELRMTALQRKKEDERINFPFLIPVIAKQGRFN